MIIHAFYGISVPTVRLIIELLNVIQISVGKFARIGTIICNYRDSPQDDIDFA